jgi:hypothetical protein
VLISRMIRDLGKPRNDVIPTSPGTGVEWDGEGVRRYLLD